MIQLCLKRDQFKSKASHIGIVTASRVGVLEKRGSNRGHLVVKDNRARNVTIRLHNRMRGAQRVAQPVRGRAHVEKW